MQPEMDGLRLCACGGGTTVDLGRAAVLVAEALEQVRAEERTRIADAITQFADQCQAGAERYAAELPICSRRSNDCVVNAYRVAAAIARDGNPRNVHCSNCGDTKGGPFGHETSECTWRPCDTAGDRERGGDHA